MPATRRAALFIALCGVVLAFGIALRVPLWRAAYPYLPRQLQALPYRLNARLARARPTPLAVPSPASGPLVPISPPAMTPPPPARATPSPTSTAAPPSPPPLLPASAQVATPRHEYQTWNNCGPATLSMALGVLGADLRQGPLAAALKPDPDDKNVSPDELAAEARRQGYGALVRVGGSLDGLKALLAAGFPVVVESWFIPEPGDEMGHYLLLVGYDDATSEFIAFDSYHGPNQRLGYEALDELWRVFNRLYVVFYAAAAEDLVRQTLGEFSDDFRMWEHADKVAAEEVARRGDAFASFNLGSSRLVLGDAPGAAVAFDRARTLGLPWRFLWYQFGPFQAYAETERWGDVLALANANLANAGNLEESHYWRGRALAASGDDAAARAAFQRALALNPGYAPAKSALGDH